MIYTIDSSQKGINWSAKGAERIIQNIKNLLGTSKYEVAYDRTLGLSRDIIDMPLQKAIAKATTEIIDLISNREPRVVIKEVKYAGADNDGNIQFKVVVDV
jgi:phage baseplate assembly protein W